MKNYLVKKVVISVLTLLIVILILFLAMDLMPGTPFNNPKLSPEQREMLKSAYGLDKPVLIRYLIYVKNMFKGDFGVSYALAIDTPVSELIIKRMPVSMAIGGAALALGSIGGLILGFTAAFTKYYIKKFGKIIDGICILISILGISIPSYIIAIALSYFVGFKFRLLPLVYDFRNPAGSSIMAVLSLSFVVCAVITRYARDEALEVLKSDYVLFAMTQGIRGPSLLFRYIIRNSFIGVITVMAMMFVGLMTGSLVTEQIFSIPGIGFLLTSAINAKDYNVVISLSFVFAALFIVVRLLLDIIYVLLDPRVRVVNDRR
ncbi:MAG: ABC transporter permease [Lachnospiraceae bacterium]|nr:ABC transporter permease [Lachnospiraceae bacterium]